MGTVHVVMAATEDVAFVIDLDSGPVPEASSPRSGETITFPVKSITNTDSKANEGLEEKLDDSTEYEEKPHHASRIVIAFWILLCCTAFVLGIVYFIVKVNKSDCDDGTALPGDVTAPDSPNFGQVLAVMYGFVPYMCLLGCVVELFRRRSLWPILLMMMGACIVFVNEGIIKRIVSQDRPSGSCLESKGMPSSHAALATAYFVNLHLELIFKPQPSSTSLAWTVVHKAVVGALLWAMLFPVPFTRVALHDHSWAQIGVGALVGLCVGVGWFLFLTYYLYKHLDAISDLIGSCKCCWGEGLFHHFVNDYFPVPEAASCNQSELREARKQGDWNGVKAPTSNSPPQTAAETNVPSMGDEPAAEVRLAPIEERLNELQNIELRSNESSSPKKESSLRDSRSTDTLH